MAILVVHCFHWLGFHITNYLLENGEEVDGIHVASAQAREHLAAFFGRNSQFQLVEFDHKKAYDTVIMIGGQDLIKRVTAKRCLIVNGETCDRNSQPLITNISVNLLFGEWMPMDLQGIYYEGKHILFNSKEFLTEAIYVNDFVKTLNHLLQTSRLPKEIHVRSRHAKQIDHDRQKQMIFLREQMPIEEHVELVKNHYKTFKHWYDH